MKLNIKKSDYDLLHYSTGMLSLFDFLGRFCSTLQTHLSSALKFLHRKLRHHAVSFTTVDSHILYCTEQRFQEIYRIVQ